MQDFKTKEKLSDDIEGVKADKYEELQREFLNDEISEATLEEEMDKLFEGGDDFLEYEEDTPMLNESQRTAVRSAKQILGVLLVTTAFVGSIVVTKGISVVAVGVLFILGGIAYARYKGAL